MVAPSSVCSAPKLQMVTKTKTKYAYSVFVDELFVVAVVQDHPPQDRSSLHMVNLIAVTICSLQYFICHSASTAEYCGTNVGVVVGSATISTLVFVDDVVDISGSEKDARKAHINALKFALKKKLNFADGKCFIMIVNGKRDHKVPELFINGEMMEEAKIMKYLGDIFNQNGSNTNLMDDQQEELQLW